MFRNTTKTKNGKTLNIATISDVHIWHPRVATKHILATIHRLFPDNQETEDLDYIFIAGDLFDRSRSMTDDEVYEAMDFFTYWLEMLGRRGVRLRVLEGTPSHDRNQSRVLVTLNKALNHKSCDLRYIDTLMVDHEEEFDFHVLYVPDEWKHCHDEVWDDVCEAMRIAGVDKVQLGVMHGMFEHQMPNGIPRPTHMSEKYLAIIEWFITIGHIHSMSIKDRIYAQGSPERLSQNEEEKKGIFKFEVNPDGTFSARFVVNEKATPFITLDLTKMELEDALKYIDHKTMDIDRGFVRLELSESLFGAGILNMIDQIAKPEIKWSKKVEKKEKDKHEKAESVFELNFPTINERSANSILKQFYESKGIDDHLIEESLELLGEYL
jgi:DNA repair exonuclease SbcCD nuclease subunit